MKIGNIELDRPLALAPMEDVTDLSFRLVCKELGADLLYTEFACCEALVRNVKRTLKKIRVIDAERPVAVQVFGNVETSMAGAARVAEQANPDFIDVNCGCWVKNVARRGAGAALLQDIKKFESVVSSVISGTKLPVTVKTRLGWDTNSIVILDVARMLEQIGVQALSVHCRVRAQGHGGDADWSWLSKLKETVSIPIIGNGDVRTPEDAKRMLDTGCDGVMIGRGSICNPWIFKQAKHFIMTGEHLPPPNLRERVDVCIRHLRLSSEVKGEHRAVLEFRKHYSGYLKSLPHVAKFRSELMEYLEVEPIVERLNWFTDQMYDMGYGDYDPDQAEAESA